MLPENLDLKDLPLETLLLDIEVLQLQITYMRFIGNKNPLKYRSELHYYFNTLAQRIDDKHHSLSGFYVPCWFETEKDYERMVARGNTYGGFEQLHYRLSDEQLSGLEKFRVALGKSTEEMIDTLIGDGYKVSESYQYDSNSVLVTITTTDNVTHTSKKFVCNWASTFSDALLIGYYKIYVVWDGGAWFEKQNGFMG